MTRDMTITIKCDGRRCDEEKYVDLEDGNLFVDDDTRIETALEHAGWYVNMDGDYCPKCADQAKKDWLKQ